MEQKLVRVPFDLELAKRINNGEIEGKIVTRDGRGVRVLCFDAKNEDNIIALITQNEEQEFPVPYNKYGRFSLSGEEPIDLILEVPEYLTFKDGDILTNGYGCVFILKCNGEYKTSFYACRTRNGDIFFEGAASGDNIEKFRRADKEEAQYLIDRLNRDGSLLAEKYLKRFFGIENSPKVSNSEKIGKNEFRAFDRVLVRLDARDVWVPHFFAKNTGDPKNPYSTINGSYWRYCIPYKGNEHLLGTTNNPEDHK